MKQRMYSIVVIVIAALCFYLYATILISSLRIEKNKTLLNSKQSSNTLISDILKSPVVSDSLFYNNFIQNPLELELYLRFRLTAHVRNNDDDSFLYRLLLKTRPTWPYFYSGLAQVKSVHGDLEQSDLNNAIKYGPHEKGVVNSLAEILFYNWNYLDKTGRLQLLEYLTDQNDIMITNVVTISAKFAKIYAYCDYIYEKKHVEYAACKQQYWQPLTDL
ncbi:MAG: hypothetical protein JKX98_00490 [Alcanivoracaceae bacterium]|nr:hypothetical protein [Alcanivoracaceae bacterium]